MIIVANVGEKDATADSYQSGQEIISQREQGVTPSAGEIKREGTAKW
jgi:hypothetical protein